MREIKFRAWDERRKDMYYINDFYWFEEEGVHDSNGEGHYANYILMQYTGLKDRNGKDIYEGDIIRDNDGFLWVVYFEDGIYCAKGGEFETIEYLIEFCPEWCEVIGNIYKNPELLEEIENESKVE
jgi:uncharacterized phage protein (TIGR01671 family)